MAQFGWDMTVLTVNSQKGLDPNRDCVSQELWTDLCSSYKAGVSVCPPRPPDPVSPWQTGSPRQPMLVPAQVAPAPLSGCRCERCSVFAAAAGVSGEELSPSLSSETQRATKACCRETAMLVAMLGRDSLALSFQLRLVSLETYSVWTLPGCSRRAWLSPPKLGWPQQQGCPGWNQGLAPEACSLPILVPDCKKTKQAMLSFLKLKKKMLLKLVCIFPFKKSAFINEVH